MKNYLKMWRSLAALRLRFAWPIAASVVLALLSVLDYQDRLWGALATAALVAGLLLATQDLWRSMLDYRELQVERTGNAIRDSVKAYNGELLTVRDHHMVVDAEVDRHLRRAEVPATYSSTPHRLPSEWRDVLPAAVAYRRSTRNLVFNDTVLRLDSDLDPSGAAEASLRPTYYFDALASNYLAGYQVVSTKSRDVVLDGTALVVDRGGRVRDLNLSWSANLIGVSTVGLTSDGNIVMLMQTPSNVSEPDRLAPTGSGSAEPRDVDPRPGLPLSEVLVRGMERELREECNVPREVSLRTRLCGYARWIDHGGKPEFFGVTWIDLTEREVLDLRIRRSERRLVSRAKTQSLDLDVLARLGGDLAGIADLVPGNLSVPLLMNLRALSIALAEDPGFAVAP